MQGYGKVPASAHSACIGIYVFAPASTDSPAHPALSRLRRSLRSGDMKASGWPTSEARSFAKQSRKSLGGDDRPYALGIWDLTRWVNDGLLMPFSLESNAKLPGKPHLEKRPRSFGKMNAVFWENEHGLFSG